MNIHWLITEDCTKSSLKNSSIASIRLRSALFANEIFKNHRITFGKEININKKFDLIFIGKIGLNQKNLMQKWIQIIKNAHCKKILDITDNHLSLRSDNQNIYYFYKEIINHIDAICVPSNKLKSIIETKVSNKKIYVIPDSIDIDIQPITQKINRKKLMWFGHPSNINSLINFIHNYSFDIPVDIVIQTSKIGMDYFSDVMRNFISEKIKIFFSLWSIENMIEVAKRCNLIIIPGDLKTDKKLGVSENRLITAFALGLPVAASNYPSYELFKDYYINIDDETIFKKLIEEPDSFSSKTINAQKKCAQYSKENISKHWLTISEEINLF